MEKERSARFYLAILALLAIVIILIIKLTGPPAPEEAFAAPADVERIEPGNPAAE
ncbi:hypothetical protein [Lujinxingia sediminis]|uniref:hypothetical protein n=1 Tax=Lujinxingia sediminis TaxID=2480984 RepID=UPI0013E334A3|nr:hypothetical protein [Lujinxingia sediminis]